jgi:glycosyltransferase involved in cell wall biosynthesis
MLKPDALGNTPTISVVIPAYNQAMYVRQAIQSVLDQTNPDFELVVVDDGSTDETPEIIARIQDPRIRVIRQRNAGLSAARNTGLRESSAPLITFLDSDDYFLPDKLEVLSRHLDNHPEVGLVVGRAKYVDQTGNTIAEQTRTPPGLVLPALLMANPICVSGILLRRTWLESVGVFDETLRACEDWDLWLRLIAAGCQMAWLENPVVAYRLHSGQMTRQSERMRKALHLTLDKFFNQPGLPEHLKVFKKTAYASALVHAAAFAYLSNEFDRGQLDLAEAVSLDPTLRDKRYKRLVDLLVDWSHDPRLNEPADFLRRIIRNPPPKQPGLVLQLRRAMADVLLGSLFKSSRETWRRRRWDLLRVILYKPDWLLNRGVLRMIADAWLPS